MEEMICETNWFQNILPSTGNESPEINT